MIRLPLARVLVALPLLLPAVLLTLAGCARPDEPATDAGCSADELRAILVAELKAFRETNPFPGATAAVFDPGAHAAPVATAVGLADLESGRPLAPADRMLAGSVGKTFFAAAALALAERGALDLDAPIAGYLDDATLPNADRVTTRMLLAHRSGYGEYDGPFMEDLIADPLRKRTRDDWTGPIRRAETLAEPGGGYVYSDVNFVLLAEVIDAAAGESAYALIDRLFLEPLALDDTVPADGPRISGLVPGYEGERSLFRVDRVLGTEGLIYNPQFEWGGGGFASTAGDLARWIAALRAGDAISEASWVAMSRPGEDGDYGLGIHRYETPAGVAYGHSGYIPGYLSWMRWYDDPGLAVAAQTNSSDPERVRDDGFDLLDAIVRTISARCVD